MADKSTAAFVKHLSHVTRVNNEQNIVNNSEMVRDRGKVSTER
jgi:hypothetical protein